MKRIDALAVIELLRDLDRCRTNEGRGAEAAVTKFINQTTEREPTPGHGTCICQHNPKSFKRMWGDSPQSLAEARGNMILDHRCPEHGEKAQPDLWGRHKDKQLSVSWKEWESLGVEYRS